MAVFKKVKGCADFSCVVLWLIITVASGVDSGSSITLSNSLDADTLNTNAKNSANYRIKRQAIHEPLPPSTSNSNSDLNHSQQDLDALQFNRQDVNIDSITTKENDKDPNVYEENIKPKLSNKQHKYTNEFKNYNSNKMNLDPKHFISNESINEKYTLLKNSNKKDSKSNSSDSVVNTNNTNAAVPNQYSFENKRLKLHMGYGPVNVTKDAFDGVSLNETHVMNDQPAVVSGSNVTDDESFDELPQNITDTFDDSNSTNADGRTMPPSEGLDILLISGIILGTVVCLALIGGGGFVFYRHRMWNKPQTLSDKCSNADSSGYIDDSTLRENSEEMYSLDNDSFLNSLEAMTIQNYWTDNVKHTKL